MSSTADTAAVADSGKEAKGTKGGEDKGVFELMGRPVDDEERMANDYEVPGPKANDYDVPRPMASGYDVPRPATLATTRFEEGSIKDEEM